MRSTIAFQSPGAGFDEPIEMWLACHQRVRRFAALLERLRRHLQHSGPDEEAQLAAVSIRRYFNEAAPRHHEDEEVDLFPLLHQRCGEQERAVLEVLERVEREHLTMAERWRGLDGALARISAGEYVELDEDAVGEFADGYDRHIVDEETMLLPALKRLLLAPEWGEIGRSMAERRGLDWKGPIER
ncbi:MAG TPA: hemerythrin domain-containing protein [Burkholderiaceae bacterium]|nr:hemerythrin domain-containing protein [Burkholderiaceae bacterium]